MVVFHDPICTSITRVTAADWLTSSLSSGWLSISRLLNYVVLSCNDLSCIFTMNHPSNHKPSRKFMHSTADSLISVLVQWGCDCARVCVFIFVRAHSPEGSRTAQHMKRPTSGSLIVTHSITFIYYTILYYMNILLSKSQSTNTIPGPCST